MERCGYLPLRNVKAQDGLWHINGIRQVIYVRIDIPPQQRLTAAQELALKLETMAGSS
jgi:hypothetical protein